MMRSLLGDLAAFLELTCLLSHDRISKAKQIFAILYIFIMLIFGFASLHFSGLQKALEGPAFLNTIGVITSSHQIFMYFNQNKIHNLLSIQRKFKTGLKEEWEKEIFRKESKMIWNIMHKYCLILMSYQISYQILPFVADSIVGLFCPDCPSLRVPIFAQGFLDLTEPRSLTNFFLSIPCIAWCGLEIVCHIGGQALLLVSIAYIRVQLKIIQQKILLIKKHTIDNHKNNEKNITETLLKDVILHHQSILKGLDSMKKALGFPIAVENTTISICFCLNLYGIIALQGKESIGAKFEGISGIGSLILVLFWSCSLGESLQDENNEIFQSIYDIAWYKEKASTVKMLIMIMNQTSKPFVIDYHMKAELNLRSFMQIINTSYSYFMVLKSTTS